MGHAGWTQYDFCRISRGMHEMSVAESIIRIAADEMEKHGLRKLLLVRIRYGAMSNVVADSLSFCFEAMTLNTPHEGAKLELEELPVTLRCGACGETFTPEGHDPFAPCPACGEILGHSVEQGRELYVQHIEAE